MRTGLDRAGAALAGIRQLDADLGGRLDVRFQQLAGEVRDGLDAGPDTATAEDLLALGDELVAETLAFLAGAAARRHGFDDGVARTALTWLDALSDAAGLPKATVVIPATTEFTGMLTQIVRLRVPSDGLWGLPVAVHEYGHFLASVLTDRQTQDGMPRRFVPVEELLHEAGSAAGFPRLYWHGHELFADALATVTVGPAYTRYCIRYRFDPAKAQAFSATHPEPARRVRLQLAILDVLSDEDVSGYLRDEVDNLRQSWSAAVVAAGANSEVRPDPAYDELESKLTAIALSHPQVASLRYRDHVAAAALADDFFGSGAQPASVAHVLNAAWDRRNRVERTATTVAEVDATVARLTQTGTRLVHEVLGLA